MATIFFIFTDVELELFTTFQSGDSMLRNAGKVTYRTLS